MDVVVAFIITITLIISTSTVHATGEKGKCGSDGAFVSELLRIVSQF